MIYTKDIIDSGCSTIMIPECFTELDDECFKDSISLINVILPKSLEIIGNRCFQNSSIKEIFIPQNVKSIGDECFNGCKSLTDISLLGTSISLGSRCFDSGALLHWLRKKDETNKQNSSSIDDIYLEQLEYSIDQLKDECNDIKSDTEMYKHDIENIETSIEEIKEKHDDLKENFTTLEVDVGECIQRLNSIEMNHEDRIRKVELKLQKFIDALSKGLHIINKTFTNL